MDLALAKSGAALVDQVLSYKMLRLQTERLADIVLAELDVTRIVIAHRPQTLDAMGRVVQLAHQAEPPTPAGKF